MSRYTFDTPDGRRWHLGWDAATASYFAQTEPTTPNTGTPNANIDTGTGPAGLEDELRDLAGADDQPGQVPTITALLDLLTGQVTVPDDIRDRLPADAPPDTGEAARAAAERIATAEALLDHGQRDAGDGARRSSVDIDRMWWVDRWDDTTDYQVGRIDQQSDAHADSFVNGHADSVDGADDASLDQNPNGDDVGAGS